MCGPRLLVADFQLGEDILDSSPGTAEDVTEDGLVRGGSMGSR